MLSAHCGCRACELLFMEVVVFAARGLVRADLATMLQLIMAKDATPMHHSQMYPVVLLYSRFFELPPIIPTPIPRPIITIPW